jgi:hypothetical protein
LYADIDSLDRLFDAGNVKVRGITNGFFDVFCAMQHCRQRVADLMGYHIDKSLLPYPGFDSAFGRLSFHKFGAFFAGDVQNAADEASMILDTDMLDVVSIKWHHEK